MRFCLLLIRYSMTKYYYMESCVIGCVLHSFVCSIPETFIRCIPVAAGVLMIQIKVIIRDQDARVTIPEMARTLTIASGNAFSVCERENLFISTRIQACTSCPIQPTSTRARAHARTHARTHTHTHMRAHFHPPYPPTHTHTHTHALILGHVHTCTH